MSRKCRVNRVQKYLFAAEINLEGCGSNLVQRARCVVRVKQIFKIDVNILTFGYLIRTTFKKQKMILI